MVEGEETIGVGSVLPTMAIATVMLLVVAIAVKSLVFSKPKLKLPSRSMGYPIVGMLFKTCKPKMHRILSDLAKEYGHLYVLCTGPKDFIVIMSVEITYEVLVKNAQTFSSCLKLLLRLNYTSLFTF